MSNFKNITDVPVVENTEGLYLIANNGGAAAQVAVSNVGAQADWNEIDETSPAFIKNKPKQEQASLIITYDLNFGKFYILNDTNNNDNGNDDVQEASVQAPEGIEVTYDILDEAMKKGIVLCDLTDYEIVASMITDATPVHNSKYGTVIGYGKYGMSEEYYEWYITTVCAENLTTFYLTFGSQPK